MYKCRGCYSDANGLVVRLTNLMDAYEASLVAARLERYDLLLCDHRLNCLCAYPVMQKVWKNYKLNALLAVDAGIFFHIAAIIAGLIQMILRLNYCPV